MDVRKVRGRAATFGFAPTCRVRCNAGTLRLGTMLLRTTMLRALLLGTMLAAALPAAAHHSASMFDQERTLEVTAEVKEFQWTNPHVWIQVYVEDAAGSKQEWSVEGGGRNSLARRGWRPTTFKPGDTVTLRMNPMRDGSPAALFVGARLADGSTIGRWDDAAD